jgi:hypothetical protein
VSVTVPGAPAYNTEPTKKPKRTFEDVQRAAAVTSLIAPSEYTACAAKDACTPETNVETAGLICIETSVAAGGGVVVGEADDGDEDVEEGGVDTSDIDDVATCVVLVGVVNTEGGVVVVVVTVVVEEASVNGNAIVGDTGTITERKEIILRKDSSRAFNANSFSANATRSN